MAFACRCEAFALEDVAQVPVARAAHNLNSVSAIIFSLRTDGVGVALVKCRLPSRESTSEHSIECVLRPETFMGDLDGAFSLLMVQLYFGEVSIAQGMLALTQPQPLSNLA